MVPSEVGSVGWLPLLAQEDVHDLRARHQLWCLRSAPSWWKASSPSGLPECAVVVEAHPHSESPDVENHDPFSVAPLQLHHPLN